MVENCGNCAFAVSPYGDYRRHCHRRAPNSFTMYKGSMNGVEQYGPGTYWPEVSTNDFCGEWELKG